MKVERVLDVRANGASVSLVEADMLFPAWGLDAGQGPALLYSSAKDRRVRERDPWKSRIIVVMSKNTQSNDVLLTAKRPLFVSSLTQKSSIANDQGMNALSCF